MQEDYDVRIYDDVRKKNIPSAPLRAGETLNFASSSGCDTFAM